MKAKSLVTFDRMNYSGIMARIRLLDIAVTEFGSKGFDGASTRSIAAAADTVMSSITYHYGGKKGLYLAAADYVAEQLAYAMGDAIITEAQIGRADADSARRAIQRLLGQLAKIMLSDSSDGWTLFILREQMCPSVAFDRMYIGAMGKIARLVVELICICTGQRDRRTAQIVTMTLIGQVAALRFGRAMWLRLLRHEALDGNDASELSTRIAANINAILDRLIAEQL